MKFEYTGRHVEVTPAIRAHVEEHFKKIETVFGEEQTRAHVRIEVEKNRHIGEIIVHWHTHTLTATDTNDDMYQALTRAIDKIEKQALKLKKKIIEKSHSGSRTQVLETSAAADGSSAIDALSAKSNGASRDGVVGAAEEGDDEPPRAPRIIAAPRGRVKPMTPEEAVMQLEDKANDEQLVVFRDADSERICVLYKRKDGNYGLIET